MYYFWIVLFGVGVGLIALGIMGRRDELARIRHERELELSSRRNLSQP